MSLRFILARSYALLFDFEQVTDERSAPIGRFSCESYSPSLSSFDFTTYLLQFVVRSCKHFVNSQSLQTVYIAKNSVKSTPFAVCAEIGRKEVKIMEFTIEIKKTYTIEADNIDGAFEKLNAMLDGEQEITVYTPKDTECK